MTLASKLLEQSGLTSKNSADEAIDYKKILADRLNDLYSLSLTASKIPDLTDNFTSIYNVKLSNEVQFPGLVKDLFKQLEISIVAGYVDDADVIVYEVRYNYTHHDGGRNGKDTRVTYEKGKWSRGR